MNYFDTSYLVRLYYDDPGADLVRQLAATDNIACAAHGQVEMIAAFHRKLREDSIRPTTYTALVGQIRAHTAAGAIQWLAQSAEVLARIGEVFAQLPASVYLRAADALHLATAAEHEFKVVYSNDAHLLAAAKYFGLDGKNVMGAVAAHSRSQSKR